MTPFKENNEPETDGYLHCYDDSEKVEISKAMEEIKTSNTKVLKKLKRLERLVSKQSRDLKRRENEEYLLIYPTPHSPVHPSYYCTTFGGSSGFEYGYSVLSSPLCVYY